MEEKIEGDSCLLGSESRGGGLYPMYIGVSCALFALKLLTKQGLDEERWIEIRDKMLQGSAHLLGLLVWGVQREEANVIEKNELLHKLEVSQKENEELRKRRSEDAKANERVARIYATQEQSWFGERKKLRQQIGALLNDLKVIEEKKDEVVSALKKKDEVVSELNGKLQEMELSVKSKDKVFEEEEEKMKELKEKLKTMETAVEELKETAKREAQAHSSELWKHKAAFIELVSNQRQLEAEMGRALKQAEAAKQQLEFVFEEKEESVLMVQKLSIEIDKMSKDLEQKDKILSAMLRKSKLDAAEKQMLLKEIKLSKAKRKQAEQETEKWRAVSDSRNERRTLRSMLSRQLSSRLEVFNGERPQLNHSSLDYMDNEMIKEPGVYSSESGRSSLDENTELALSANVKRLEGWVHSEAGKYQSAIEQRHQLELGAFTEQMRQKDDKLQAYRWRSLSAELESKRLHSQIEGLNQDISQLRHDNIKLEALLLEREEELKSLKVQIALHLNAMNSQKAKLHSSRHELPLRDDIVWSKVRIIKRKPAEKELEAKKKLVELSHVEENEQGGENESVSKNTALMVQSSTEDSEEVKEVALELHPICEGTTSPEEVEILRKDSAPDQCLDKKDTSLWRMDLHALGVSCKIKRLKQQLLMLERLMAKQENGESRGSDDRQQIEIKGLLPLLSLLNKQVSRYQSLQEKTDDLCKRMHDNQLYVIQGESSSKRTKEETRKLELFLEETFQLQRFVVATGQKLVEIQSKVTSIFVGISEEPDGSGSADMNRFADNVRALFREVQRGLEVRIARIIGDLEGTLACDGIHSRK
ncbi:hypothetical protein Ancab_009065 [Ancistrocladus abbreviatus]